MKKDSVKSELALTVIENITRLVNEVDGGNQSQAARRCGIEQVTLCRYINKKCTPMLDIIELIANGYGVEATQLFIPDTASLKLSLAQKLISDASLSIKDQ